MTFASRIVLGGAILTAGCRAQTAAPGRRPTPPRPPSQTSPSTPEIVSPGAPMMPDSVHWVRNSAEYRAAVLQAYRLATERIERAQQGRKPGSWAVVADADETLINNSQYQKERAALGGHFTDESWSEWVTRKQAPALPGAVDFAKRVQDLGGKFIVVTNRDEPDCPATEATLRSDGFVFDAVLCRPEGAPGSKQPRFDAIVQGRVKGLPALEIVLWVGDNIQDFPGLSQDARTTPAAMAGFGTRFILIPNPMYGSWERTPRN
jgi:5'-nucleotidase (lipoprotein e(P4) family)